jgi:alkylation response protein AidB-like acyl-CoA dehydrogenase
MWSTVVATEAALLVTSRALQTIGGRSAHKSYPLERIFRDIRTCTLKPPNTDRATQLIAQDALGIGDESQESGDTF